MEFNWTKVPHWNSYPGLLHGFVGRRGGKSIGPYAGLNVSYRVGDDARVVSQNVCDVKQAVGIHDGRIVTMKQVHGDQIIEVRDSNIKEAGEADGMVTTKNETYLGVLTADCVPILFVAPEKKVVAAVHAGWRGTLAGIGAKMVHLFETQYGISPTRVEATLGPAIGACCYEVGDDVTTPLIGKWGKLASACIRSDGGKIFLDLRKLNRAILASAGLPSHQIHEAGPCTSCAKEDFFSYRRERKETGRQISFVGWRS